VATNWQNFLWKLWVAVPILTGCLVASIGTRTVAQITPDGTLGNEASQVKPINDKVDRIDGGAVRGVNLFHSFQDFNVGEGRGAYFANPAGVENILSRVTGANPSNIFGTLGVLGNANLYLLNPNGIIFGQNAKLDIRGSFVGSAGGGVNFSDRTLFGADKSQATPLLTMAVPVGLQYGTQQTGNISSSGNLAVGQDLTLSAGHLDLQGRLEAGRNLTLQATNTVRVRDSVENPFLARTGGNLLIQGNQGIDILALNHLGTPFQSGGNLSLVSDGIISGDAHFASGGNLSISNLAGKPGNFLSLYDPIITVNGDISFASYNGASLQVVAGGSINVSGDITINTIDPSLDPTNFVLTLQAGVPNAVDNVAFPYATQGTTFNKSLASLPESITVTGNISTTSNPLTVGLSAPGNIQTQAITSNGGAITLDSRGGTIDTSRGTLYSGAGGGNGGEITLKATGDITADYIATATKNDRRTADVNIASFNGSVTLNGLGSDDNDMSVDARAITINTPGVLKANGFLNARSDFVGDSGNIIIGNTPTLVPSSITIGGMSTRNLGVGDGGNIYVTTTGSLSTTAASTRGTGKPIRPPNSDIITNGFSIGSEAGGNGGDITINAGGGIKTVAGIVSNSHTLGNGGNITLNSSNGAITIKAGTVDSSSQNGNGGIITFNAAGNIITPSILSNSRTNGNGGDITLISRSELIDTLAGTVNSSSNSGNGGKITFDAASNITAGNIFSNSNGFGRGGDITLTSRGGLINTLAGTVNSFSNIGTGGIITFDAAGNITTGSILSYSGSSGKGGDITLASRSGTIDTTAGILNASSGTLNPLLFQISGIGGNVTLIAKDNIFSGFIESIGLQGGRINLNSDGNIFLNRADIASITTGSGRGGNIEFTAQSIDLTDARVANVFSNGQSGDVVFKASDSIKFLNTDESSSSRIGSPLFQIFKTAFPGTGIANTTLAGTGNGGNTTVDTKQFTISNEAKLGNDLVGITTSTQGSKDSRGGDLTINASESVTISGNQPGEFIPEENQDTAQLVNNISTGLTTAALGEAKAGNLTINTGKLVVQDGAGVSSGNSLRNQEAGKGDGGNLTVSASQSVKLTGKAALATSTSGSSNPGTLVVNAGQVTLNDGALFAADTLGDNPAGNVEIRTNKLTVQSGSRIGSATSGRGTGGSIKINSPDKMAEVVEIDGTSANGKVRSGIFTNSRGLGKAGNIDIYTDNLNVQNRGEISVSGNSSGASGEINVTAGNILMTQQAGIRATTNSSGGNINLTVAESINMRNNSDPKNATEITARAFGTANGGNITMKVGNFVLANLFENSDIVAEADQGSGGRIDAKDVIAIKFIQHIRGRRLSESEFIASSLQGLEGTINVDPSEPQPVPVLDAPVVREIVQVCPTSPGATTREAGRSQYFNSGRGGLPPNPGEVLESNIPQVPWVTLDSDNQNPTSAANSTTRNISSPETIEEAQGWVKLPDGKFLLTKQTPTSPSVSCVFQSSQP
jgi:filamentous hemagglutinin family protein